MNERLTTLRGMADARGYLKLSTVVPEKPVEFITTSASNEILSQLEPVCANCPMNGRECLGAGGVYTKGMVTEDAKKTPIDTRKLPSACGILGSEFMVKSSGIILEK